MTPLRTLALLGALSLAVTGCGGLGDFRMPVMPIVLSDVSVPLTTDFDRTPVGSKEGRATTYFVRIPVQYVSRWLTFAWGEADIKMAAANGGIKTIAFADYHNFSLFDMIGIYTVKVYGD